MNAPIYSYDGLNNLALSDTGHFVYLDAWSISAITSIFAQALPLYLWANNQYPLDQAQIDDLMNKQARALGQLMHPLVGLIMPVCTQVLPDGTLLCDGATYNRSDYPNLYDAIDTFYHVDADTFTVPDLTGKFVLGPDGAHPVNSGGGSFDHVQTVGELASHSHTSAPHSHTESAAAPTAIAIGPGVPAPSALPAGSVTGATAVSIDSAGSSEPMDITPPFMALRYVVVAL